MIAILTTGRAGWTPAATAALLAGLCVLSLAGCGFSPARGDAVDPLTRNPPAPAEVKAAPAMVKAAPAEVKADPAEVKADPVEVKAAPVVEETVSDIARDAGGRHEQATEASQVATGSVGDEAGQNAGESAMFKFTSNIAAPRGVEYADDGSFSEKVLQSDQPVLVDFYADWCGPCRRMAPVLEEVAREAPGARVVKVDVDQAPGVARKYRISSIPALVVFRDGQPVASHVGTASKSRLKQMLQR